MADVAIIAPEVAAAPQDYTLPGAQEILLKAVGCQINGANASGAFLPALQMLDPAGHVMWTSVNASQPVAAGGSALVSWFLGGGLDRSGSTSAGGITKVTSNTGTLAVSAPTGPTASIDMPTTGVVPGSYGDASDAVTVTVDAEGRITSILSVPISGGGTVVASDGWVPDTTETWTFASFTAGPPAAGTFTVAGDLRAKYTIGTRIKLTQTTTKYFVVSVAPTYNGVNTTVTITGGTDYTLANAAISANYHSYVSNPQGYPGSFAFNAGPTGWSALTTNSASFNVQGTICLIQFVFIGTSNATSVGWTAPVAAAGFTALAAVLAEDNGSILSNGVRCQLALNSTTGAVLRDWAGNGWTSSGTKLTQGEIMYPIQ